MDFTSKPKPGYPAFAASFGWDYPFRDDSVRTQCGNLSRDFIQSYVKNVHNGIIAEIGVFGGATLLDLYSISKENNNKLFGIDPFDKITIFNGESEEETDQNIQKDAREIFKINKERLLGIISKYSLDDIITVINEPSQNVTSIFEDNSIDLLHIDGDHSTEGVYNDLVNYWPKMKKKTGIIVGDDFNWKSVRDGLDKFCQEYNLEYTSGCSGYKFIIHA